MPIRNQAGDTIIEVLIAIVVVASALAGAFVSANRSQRTTIQNRERDQAVKIAQTQIEYLRAAIDVPSLSIKTRTAPFCLVISGASVTTPGGCNLDSDNQAHSPSSTSIPYLVQIVRDPAGTDPNLYDVRISWDRLGGDTDNTNILYRIY